jgi:hypothetical protein
MHAEENRHSESPKLKQNLDFSFALEMQIELGCSELRPL